MKIITGFDLQGVGGGFKIIELEPFLQKKN
jgi:hypothetical protein